MQYGHFDDAAREYVIETPATPLPWINYLGNEDFFSLISNTGGGYSFYKDAAPHHPLPLQQCAGRQRRPQLLPEPDGLQRSHRQAGKHMVAHIPTMQNPTRLV